MGLFSRKKKIDHSSEEQVEPVAEKKRGPYDIEDDYQKGKRLNMGALRIPAIPNMQVHPSPTPDGEHYTDVTLIHNGSALNLMVLTDSKSGSFWSELQESFLAQAKEANSTVEQGECDFGQQFIVSTPVTTPNGQKAVETMRFIGISGKSWLLRVIISGKAITDEQARVEIEDILSNVVVDRGNAPVPPGEILLLSLPENLSDMLHSAQGN